MNYVRKCITCGNTFEAAANAHYCSKCKLDRVHGQRIQSKKRLRDGTARQLGGIELCAICGQQYMLKAARQKYCSGSCAEAGLKTYFKARYIANKPLTRGE